MCIRDSVRIRHGIAHLVAGKIHGAWREAQRRVRQAAHLTTFLVVLGRRVAAEKLEQLLRMLRRSKGRVAVHRLIVSEFQQLGIVMEKVKTHKIASNPVSLARKARCHSTSGTGKSKGDQFVHVHDSGKRRR